MHAKGERYSNGKCKQEKAKREGKFAPFCLRDPPRPTDSIYQQYEEENKIGNLTRNNTPSTNGASN
jgi:hypothetical protein